MNISPSEYRIFTTSVRNVISYEIRSQEEPLTLLGLASTPVLGVLRPGSDVSFVGSRLRPVPSLQLSLSSGDASPSAVLSIICPTSPSFSPNYTKDTFPQGPSPRRNPLLPLSVLRVSQARHSGYMRDGLDGGGRFIPADVFDVHTLSLLLSSRIAHDRATGNYTQHNIPHHTSHKEGTGI